MSKKNLAVVVSVVDEFSSELESATKGFANLGTIAKTAFIGVGTAMVVSAVDIDRAFKQMTKLTGATGKDLENLKNNFRAVSVSVPQSATDVANALGGVNTRLGLTGTQLEKTSRSFLDFARINNIDVDPAIRGVTRMMQDWGVEASQTDSLLDKLTVAGQATGVSIEQLTTVGVNYGVQLRALGFSLDESIAMLSKFEKEGVSTEKMVSGLSTALARMAREGIEDPSEAFKILIQRIEEAGSVGEATSIAMETLGARAGPDFALAVREGRFELEEYTAMIQNSAGATTDTAKETLTFSDNILILKNNFGVLSESILAQPLEWFNSQLGQINETLAVNKTLKNSIQATWDSDIERYHNMGRVIEVTTGKTQEFYMKYQEATNIVLEANAQMSAGNTKKSQKLMDEYVAEIAKIKEWKNQNKESLEGAILDQSFYVAQIDRLGAEEVRNRENILNNLKITDQTLRKEIMLAGENLTVEMVDSIVEKANVEVDEMQRIRQEIKTKSIEEMRQTQVGVVDNFGEIAVGIAEKIPALAGVIGNANSEMSKIKDHNESAKTWGGHFLSNFASGILSRMPLLSGAIATAKSVLAQVKFSTNPDIPSEVWGRHFTENFASGMGEALPTIQNAVNSLSNKLHEVSGGGGMTRSGSGGGITINISGNTLLDSRGAEKIGELLMKELRRNVIPA